MENERMAKRVRREAVHSRGDMPEDGGLIRLPDEILHRIMLHVSQNLKDHFNAIAAIRSLRRVTEDEAFLKEIDLYSIQYPWVNDGGSKKKFFIRCHHAGNISALFIQGCSLFFHVNDLENGMAMIRQAALSGYELAIYFYSNLMRILSPDVQIDLQLLNPSRDLVKRMRRKVETSGHHFWQPNPMPQLYLDKCDAFDSRCIRLCQCAWTERWAETWMETVKDPWMCDLCFYSVHVLGFIVIIPNKLEKWPIEYYF